MTLKFIFWFKQCKIFKIRFNYLVSTVSQLFAGATMLTGIDFALINFSVTESAGISRVATAGEVIDTVLTDSILTKIVDTVIVVGLTSAATEARGTVANVGTEAVSADSSIVTRR